MRGPAEINFFHSFLGGGRGVVEFCQGGFVCPRGLLARQWHPDTLAGLPRPPPPPGHARQGAEEGALLPCLFGWLESSEGGGSARWWLLSLQRATCVPAFNLLFSIFHRDVPTFLIGRFIPVLRAGGLLRTLPHFHRLQEANSRVQADWGGGAAGVQVGRGSTPPPIPLTASFPCR